MMIVRCGGCAVRDPSEAPEVSQEQHTVRDNVGLLASTAPPACGCGKMLIINRELSYAVQ